MSLYVNVKSKRKRFVVCRTERSKEECRCWKTAAKVNTFECDIRSKHIYTRSICLGAVFILEVST